MRKTATKNVLHIRKYFPGARILASNLPVKDHVWENLEAAILELLYLALKCIACQPKQYIDASRQAHCFEELRVSVRACHRWPAGPASVPLRLRARSLGLWFRLSAPVNTSANSPNPSETSSTFTACIVNGRQTGSTRGRDYLRGRGNSTRAGFSL